MGNSLNPRPGEGEPEGRAEGMPAHRATLTRLEWPDSAAQDTAATQGVAMETIEVRWNPASYRLRRASHLAHPALPVNRVPLEQLAAARDEFSTELFLDTSGELGVNRDAHRMAEILRGWMEPLPGGLLPSRILFLWGTFRFVGFIEEIDEKWIRFDPDGTPIRGRLRIRLIQMRS